MFHHNIERELSDGEPWAITQYSHLPTDINLLVEKEKETQNIWESPTPESNKHQLTKTNKQRRFSLYPLFGIIRNKLLRI